MKFKKMFQAESIDFNSKDSVHIYTDGSCINNGKSNAACGWAYLIHTFDGVDTHESGKCMGSTNNQMEMTAVLKSLKTAELRKYFDRPITIYSDSKYVIETLKGNFSIHKNHELWSELKLQVSKFKYIQFIWIKGHADDPYNEMVDNLANFAAKSIS